MEAQDEDTDKELDNISLHSFELIQHALPEPYKDGTLQIMVKDAFGRFVLVNRRVELQGPIMTIYQSALMTSSIWIRSEIADVQTHRGSEIPFGLRVEFISAKTVSCFLHIEHVVLACAEIDYLPWLRAVQASLEMRCLLHRVIGEQQLNLIEAVGRGAFGVVYRATLAHHVGEPTPVAVKQLSGFQDDITRVTEFLNEASILARLQHPCLLTFYGLAVLSPSEYSKVYALVTEFCDGGNLKSKLYSLSPDGHAVGPGEQPFSRVDAVRVGREIACGLEYLHSHRICHRDLKPENVLFHKDGGIKIVDFGSSCEVSDRGMTANIGSLLWTAPEVFTEGGLCRSSVYSTKVDIYSFGILFWQMWTRQEPYKHVRYFWEIRAGVQDGTLRPPLDESWPTLVATLMKWCWCEEPKGRPSATQVLACLHYPSLLGPEAEAETQEEDAASMRVEHVCQCMQGSQTATDGPIFACHIHDETSAAEQQRTATPLSIMMQDIRARTPSPFGHLKARNRYKITEAGSLSPVPTRGIAIPSAERMGSHSSRDFTINSPAGYVNVRRNIGRVLPSISPTSGVSLSLSLSTKTTLSPPT